MSWGDFCAAIFGALVVLAVVGIGVLWYAGVPAP